VRKKLLLVSILLAIVVLLAGSVAATAAAGGTGPDDALVPDSDWHPLAPADSLWYGFQYAGDGSQIQVRLDAEPDDGATFEVWTPDGIRRWGAGLEADPVGRGGTDPAAPGALVWSGNFNEPGSYYVVVEHAGNPASTNYYQLTVSGDGVTLSATPPAPTAMPAPTGPQTRPAPPSKATGRLVFQTHVGGGIYTINVDGSGLQRVTSGMDPTWSPNGQEIAFIRWEEPRGVWVRNLEKDHEWRAFDWTEPRWTSWSPQGDEIMFSRVSGGRLEEREFCFWGFCFTLPPNPHWITGIVSTDGSSFYEPTQPHSQVSRAPSWSPDGEKWVFADVQGLRVQTLDGSVSYEITHDAKDTSPTWSPDGDRVALVRRQHDHWEIYVVDADGRNPRRLTDTPQKPNGQVGNSVSPAWSPDGDYIAFLSDRSGKWEIWLMQANGSGQRPMFDTELDGLRLDYAFIGERAISWTE
jgi:dipeptidyl aminopeptidase/acylaminoacyl peptidase